MKIGPRAPSWEVIEFPSAEVEREKLIATLFVDSFANWVASESEPSLAPFGAPAQNAENDLDFRVGTSAGEKLMELAEFAPLQSHGPTFANAPKELHPQEKSALALELIGKKSNRQGGADRFLVLYATEQGFWLDPFTIERLRRSLANDPPRFDRIYWLSVHDLKSASASEIFPGTPHHFIGDRSDEELDEMGIYVPHPTQMEVVRTAEWMQIIGVNGKSVAATFKYTILGLDSLKRSRSRQ
jgi:hypothetical protein